MVLELIDPLIWKLRGCLFHPGHFKKHITWEYFVFFINFSSYMVIKLSRILGVCIDYCFTQNINEIHQFGMFLFSHYCEMGIHFSHVLEIASISV